MPGSSSKPPRVVVTLSVRALAKFCCSRSPLGIETSILEMPDGERANVFHLENLAEKL